MKKWKIEEIKEAISKPETRRGVSQYLEIIELFPSVNVAENSYFQRKFNAFYRVRQRSPEWYKTYFSCMQQWKAGKPSFDRVLDQLHRSLGRYEPSFSSKLVATVDPEQPIWDTFVLRNTQTRCPSYTSKNKLAEAKIAYEQIRSWYGQFLNSEEGQLVISVFDQNVREHAKITNLKKVDFVLWQTRREQSS